MVIINADDFGLNESCSKAIALTFMRELVTDTTIMANGEYFDQAVKLAKERGFSDKIGVHLNITEGEPLSEGIKTLPDFVTNGLFNKSFSMERELSETEKDAVYEELSAQVIKIENAGISITHADSHHYIHNAPFIAPIAEKVCKEHDIKKIRLQRNYGNMSDEDRTRARQYYNMIRSKGFITTEFFARLSEAENSDIPDSIEYLVHPDFNKSGELIDRHGTKDGFAFGSNIPDLKTEKNAVLGNYREL